MNHLFCGQQWLVVYEQLGCHGNHRYFNDDINSWDTSAVTDMSSEFMACVAPGRVKPQKKARSPPLSEFVSSVLTIRATRRLSPHRHVFELAQEFNQPLDKWNVSLVEHLQQMFADARKFNQLLQGWDVSRSRSLWGAPPKPHGSFV